MDKKSWFSLLLLILLLSGCAKPEKWHTSTVLYFDTVCEIKSFATVAQFQSAKEKVHQLFSEIELLFSPGVKNYSSPKVIQLYLKAMKVFNDSDGDFDISVAPLTNIWGFTGQAFRIPTSTELKKALNRVGMNKTRLEDNGLVLPPGMELDWGGIAKGYGIDLAAQSLIAMGITRGFINAGGDLYCWGTNPDNQAWQIGIKHPRKAGFSGVLSLIDTGTATTGDYQRFFIRDNVRYHHILNPRTGFPASGKQSVTVIGPETILCDALSTAAFVSIHPDAILNHYPEYGAIIISTDGRMSQVGKKYPFRPIR